MRIQVIKAVSLIVLLLVSIVGLILTFVIPCKELIYLTFSSSFFGFLVYLSTLTDKLTYNEKLIVSLFISHIIFIILSIVLIFLLENKII